MHDSIKGQNPFITSDEVKMTHDKTNKKAKPSF